MTKKSINMTKKSTTQKKKFETKRKYVAIPKGSDFDEGPMIVCGENFQDLHREIIEQDGTWEENMWEVYELKKLGVLSTTVTLKQ